MGSSVTLTHSADKSELFLDVCTVYKDCNARVSALIFWTLHFAQVKYNHGSKLYLLCHWPMTFTFRGSWFKEKFPVESEGQTGIFWRRLRFWRLWVFDLWRGDSLPAEAPWKASSGGADRWGAFLLRQRHLVAAAPNCSPIFNSSLTLFSKSAQVLLEQE